MYKKIILDNGLRLVTFNMPARQSVSVGIWINAGGRYETAENKGISHFLEHILFKGTKKYSCRKIKETIEGVGGSLNGFTSEELTCYLVKIPSEHWELALDILSDMVINPALPQQEIEKEKPVILEEIKMYKDLPQSYVYELLDELLWPNQPLGLPIIGTLDSVNKTSRDDLYSFKETFYTPSNIVVSAAGQLDFKGLIKSVDKLFSSLKKKDKNNFLKAVEDQEKPQLKIFNKDTEQTHMALGFHSFRRSHPLRHALGILHVVLGANMSSRLFNELREKRGLAYDIGTLLKRLHDTGCFVVHAGIDNKRVEEAIALILGELTKVKHNLVDKGEFMRAKEFYLGQLKLSLEDTLDHMLWIGEATSNMDRTYTLSDIIKEIKKIDRQDIRRVAQILFDEKKINLALIGPLADNRQDIYDQLHIS